ncbi:MAG: hypothetical protein AAGJ50_03010, partial [Pseudomonadota bacterium]
LVNEAISVGTGLLCDAISAYASQFETSRERVVKAFVHTLGLSSQVDVLSRPMSFDLPDTDRSVIPDEAIVAARRVLEDLLRSDMPSAPERADEIAETAVRFFLSLAAYKRPGAGQDDIEGYIERAILPALGL